MEKLRSSHSSRTHGATMSPYVKPSSTGMLPRVTRQHNAPVILMVSGGSDSVALLVMALHEKLDLFDGSGPTRIDRSRLHVLHVNHLLRGADSDADESFVVDLCERFDVDYTVKRIDVGQLMYQAAHDGAVHNLESVARDARYKAAFDLLQSFCDERNITSKKAADMARIVTAHTQDDRVETFLMRLIEGAGRGGLSSIKEHRGFIVRPLLRCTRQALRTYLTNRGYTWREDLTNQDTTRFRSYVRHEVVPVLQARNPQVADTIATTLDLMRDEDAFLEATAQDARAFCTSDSRSGLIALESGKLSRLDRSIARRVIYQALREVEAGRVLVADPLVDDKTAGHRQESSPEGRALELCRPQLLGETARFEARHIEAVLDGVSLKPFSLSLPGGIEVRREFDDLVISLRDLAYNKLESTIVRIPGKIELSGGAVLCARLITVPPGANPVWLAQSLSVPYEFAPHLTPLVFDADAAGFTEDDFTSGKAFLAIDPPKPGDAIHPFGMSEGRKKVYDLLTEVRIPRRDRSFVPIVRSGKTGAILCIAGIRLDRRVACTQDSSRLVELSFQPSSTSR